MMWFPSDGSPQLFDHNRTRTLRAERAMRRPVVWEWARVALRLRSLGTKIEHDFEAGKEIPKATRGCRGFSMSPLAPAGAIIVRTLLRTRRGVAEAQSNSGVGRSPRATCGASVARYGQPREKRSVRGEPAGYELREEPHALRLACLPLCEKPERSVHVQVGARHPRQ